MTKSKNLKNDLNIMHVHPFHQAMEYEEDSSEDISTLKLISQFYIAQYLQNNAHLPIVHQSLDHDLDFHNVSLESEEVHSIFPNGFPKIQDIFDMTDLQIELLCTIGSAKILLYLGVLPKLYKAIDADHYVLTNSEAETNLYIEKLAVENAKRASDLHYGKDKNGDVIVLFESSHNFQEAVDFYNYKLTDVWISDRIFMPVYLQKFADLIDLFPDTNYEDNFKNYMQVYFRQPLDDLMIKLFGNTIDDVMIKLFGNTEQEMPLVGNSVCDDQSRGSNCLYEETPAKDGAMTHEDL